MKKTKHLLGRCELCDRDVVFCATCGNNCCNGTYGGKPGQWCLDCPDAYDVQDFYFENPGLVEFAGRGKTIPDPFKHLRKDEDVDLGP